MKRITIPMFSMIGLLALASTSYGQVGYVKTCSLYGPGFNYVAATDICVNQETGDARQETTGGTWRSVLPYKDGEWVTIQQQECGPAASLVKIGDFKSTDFRLNAYNRLETAGVPLRLKPPQFLTKIMMSGGFYDPMLANARAGSALDKLALCVRSIDPTVAEPGAQTPYGNGGAPIGCVVNSRIAGMPAAYSVGAMGAYPEVDHYYVNGDTTNIAGPYVFGSQLVVTTDILTSGPDALSSTPGQPLSGTLSVSACLSSGTPGSAN